MFYLEGKYNKAKVMLADKSDLEEGTKEQIERFLSNKYFAESKIVIMPDCHVGYGACIGLTMTMNDYIIPNIVGVDLFCGVLSLNLGRVNIDLPLLDNWIFKNIAHGFNVNKEIQNTAKCFMKFYKKIEAISDKIQSNSKRNKLAVGSLGGGNHFIEVGIDSSENKWLTIHCGSRKFGMDIATHYQNIAKRKAKKGEQKDLAALERNSEGLEYLKDIKCAAEFASLNRNTIAQKILKYLNVKAVDRVESVHNYIDEDGIIRKGAVSASSGERLVIPFNMEDGLILGVGKGNTEWNNSAPHGAGRVLSRKHAFIVLNLDDAVKGMREAGVYTTSMNKGTLDEAKAVYKDKDLILKAIDASVDIIDYVKPIYNFKADEKRNK